MKQMSSEVPHCTSTRRGFIAGTVSVCAALSTDSVSAQFGSLGSASLTKQQRHNLSVVQVIDELRSGNERFRGIESIRRRSPILEELEKKGALAIVGAMYDPATGMVEMICEKSFIFRSAGASVGNRA